MSQKLRDLLKPVLGSNAASAFGEKYLSPSAPIPPEFVPDSDNRRAVLIESTSTFRLEMPTAGLVGVPSSWEANIYSLPVPGCPGFIEANTTGATTNGASSGGLHESNPLMDTITTCSPKTSPTDDNPGYSALIDFAGSSYRINAKSVTLIQDASTLIDRGTLYAADIGNLWSPQTRDTSSVTVHLPNYDWEQSGISSKTITAVPGSFTGATRDGVYAIHRSGKFAHHNAKPAYIASPLLDGSVSYYEYTSAGPRVTADRGTWHPAIDMGTIVIRLVNLDPQSVINVKLVTVYEIIPSINSPIQSLAVIPNIEFNLETIKIAAAQFGQFYPADFNDWGTLWNGAKQFFDDNRGLIGGLAAAVPGVGNTLKSIVDVIPKSSPRVTPAPNKGATKKKVTQTQRFDCPKCHKTFVNAQQLANHKKVKH